MNGSKLHSGLLHEFTILVHLLAAAAVDENNTEKVAAENRSWQICVAFIFLPNTTGPKLLEILKFKKLVGPWWCFLKLKTDCNWECTAFKFQSVNFKCTISVPASCPVPWIFLWTTVWPYFLSLYVPSIFGHKLIHRKAAARYIEVLLYTFSIVRGWTE